MSETIKKARSPSCPQIALVRAVALATKLHAKAGKASISRETALGPLEFASMHGGALTTLSALSQYGLIDAEYGGKLKVSDLAIKLIHPLNSKQEEEARREAALNPKVFQELIEGGYGEVDEGVLANHLVQSQFTPDAAKKVASVFRENFAFAGLQIGRTVEENAGQTTEQPADLTKKHSSIPEIPIQDFFANPFGKGSEKSKIDAPAANPHKMLAQYTIPLGANQATLVFTGQELTADDFDALVDFVEFSKRQFQRAQKNANPKLVEVPPSREVAGDFHAQHGAAYKPGE